MTERERYAVACKDWAAHLRAHDHVRDLPGEWVLADELERLGKFLEAEQDAVDRFLARPVDE